MEGNRFELIPYVGIKPNYIVSYNIPSLPDGSVYHRHTENVLPVSNDHKGKISSKASSKIRNSSDYILYLSDEKQIYPSTKKRRFSFRIGFITLTLSSKQVHSDDEIKTKLLNHFLITATRKWNVKNYLWRAESQQNGNIHFHILLDKFIPWSELRDTWNNIQNKLGYVDRYRSEMLFFHSSGFKARKELLKSWNYKSQVKAYLTGSKQDWRSPNSTDVHSVRKIKNLSAYMAKYMSKNIGPRKIEGRLWGCSTSISSLRGVVVMRDNAVNSELLRLKKIYPDKIYHFDYFTVFYITPRELKDANSFLFL